MKNKGLFFELSTYCHGVLNFFGETISACCFHRQVVKQKKPTVFTLRALFFFVTCV
nr:MAG TPA: hypothetical protein [Caudoviricetes sp.]